MDGSGAATGVMIGPTLRDDYRRDGFCVLPSVLGTDELGLLAATADVLMAESADRDDGSRSHDINRGDDRRFLSLRHQDFPALTDFVLGERIGTIAAALLGVQPYLFVEQFVVKGPTTGARFAWHQDSGYVGFDHRPYLTLWIAIDATTEANGCIYVLPRTPEHRDVVEPHRWDATNKERVGYDGDEPGRAIECPAGSIIAFSSTTMHRSGPNTTGAARRAYVCQYSPEPIIDPATGEPKHFATPLAVAGVGDEQDVR